MLRFAEKVYEDYVSGTQPVYTDMRFADLLGSVDKFSIVAVADNPSGSPTLTIQVEHSFEGVRWMTRNATPEFTASVTTSYTFDAADDGSVTAKPLLALARLKIALSGGSLVLRMWATGRDPAR